MHYVGIIAEYNPFHSGHRHQIRQTRALLPGDSTLMVILSGNWVQQANCAILDKWTRSELALEGGADLVLELPTPWATASAQAFARGGVALLQATGLATHLSFGSEIGDLAPLQEVAQALDHPGFPPLLQEALKTGDSFPRARQRALEQHLGRPCPLLASPNNTLALEYLSALRHFSSEIQPLTIPRAGGGFHSTLAPQDPLPPHTSATQLRRWIQAGEWNQLAPYLPGSSIVLLKEREQADLAHCHRAILAKLASFRPEDWAQLPDSGQAEGLPQRLARLGPQANSLEDFLSQAKTKRYTHARLRRLVLSAFLGIKKDDIPPSPPYLRILACNPRGQQALGKMRDCATLPLLTKAAHVRQLSPVCQALFQQEATYTDLYGLCFPTITPRGEEWRQPPRLGSGPES